MRNCVRVALQSLNLPVKVRILVPQPKTPRGHCPLGVFYCIQGFETSSERREAGFGSKRPGDGCVKREENPHGENSAIFAEAHGLMKIGR